MGCGHRRRHSLEDVGYVELHHHLFPSVNAFRQLWRIYGVAKKIIVELIDDFDGTSTAEETV